jgi:hypothetical protein
MQNINYTLNEIGQEREKVLHEFSLIKNEKSNSTFFNTFPQLFTNETNYKDDILYFTLLTKLLYFIVNNEEMYQ